MTRWLARSMVVVLVLAAGCGDTPSPDGIQDPTFSDPFVKVAQTADASFAAQLHAEAVALDPTLSGAETQVHMGFWSGSGNRAALVALLDSVNGTPLAPGEPPRRAIWDEGVTTAAAARYPAYVLMTAERWYERAEEEAGGSSTFFWPVATDASGGWIRPLAPTATSVTYVDPHPVTFDQADLVWGQYSERYTEMAADFLRDTGVKVKAWCFVEGAGASRIFYEYECPRLWTLQFWGLVEFACARSRTADWRNPADWQPCPSNCVPPATP
jgi:hypothetical protein